MGYWFDVYAFRFGGQESRKVALLFNNITDRKRRELNTEFLANINADFALLTNTNEIMRTIGEKTSAYFGGARVSFSEINETAEQATVIYSRQEAGDSSIVGMTFRLADFMSTSFLGELKTGQTIAISDVITDPRTLSVAEAYQPYAVRSQIQSPYLRDGHWKFLLTVQQPEPYEWPTDAIELMHELAARLWLRLERARAEDALRESEERYRALADLSPDAILVNVDGRFTYANSAAARLLGAEQPSQIKGRSPFDFIDTQYHDIVRERLEQMRQRQAVKPLMEQRWRRIDGATIDVEVSAGATAWQGKPAIQVLLRDITDRKQAEAALHESEDRLRMAIESAQLGTWDWNLTTNELKWDVGCKAMFGVPSDAESSIEVFFAGLHPADRQRLQNVVEWALDPASGGSYDTEYRTVGLQDQIERWVAAKGQAYFNAEGKPLRFIGTVLDITNQKQAEAQREQLLQREQAAREAAERANRIKDEFLAVLSHELRSPLNPILGWSKLLQSRTFNQQQTKHALETIERNAKLQTQLIEDLLDVSRILQGKLILNQAAVNLGSTIEAALETVRLTAEAKKIQIQTVLDAQVGPILGDAARLQQVIWNLLSNAMKFAPSGGMVEIRLEQIETYAQIQVKDNGKGIKPEFLPSVFEYFRQEDGTTTRQFGGLGLGLAIVHHLVELHGGSVWAESPGEGLGATFTVRLPLMLVSTTTPQDNLQPAVMVHLGGLQILVVDDEPDMREVVSFILEQAGAVVRAAASGSEALNFIEQSLPDVLICDVGMPDMDGYMLMRQLRTRATEQGGQIPAIALTAYAGEVNQQQAIAAGFQRHLAKPVEPDELVGAIKTLGKEFADQGS
jgi:PAS domain S-box-containing protein